MYKLLYNNKFLICIVILFFVYMIFRSSSKKDSKKRNLETSDSSSLSKISLIGKEKKTTSILPDPRKRIENIHSDIKYLQHLTNNRNDDQIRLITKYDREPENYFYELCKEKKIKFKEGKVAKLINYIEQLSKTLKSKYKIPRPCDLAKKLKINIDSLAKLNTFSYPCGKVLKSKLLSHYFSYIDPRYDYEFQQITKDIELACLYSGINTPFDVRGSLLLAQKLMEKKVLKKFI
jgi:hypothetical protein